MGRGSKTMNRLSRAVLLAMLSTAAVMPARAENWLERWFGRDEPGKSAPTSRPVTAPPVTAAPAPAAPAAGQAKLPAQGTSTPAAAPVPAPAATAQGALPAPPPPTFPVAHPRVQRFSEFMEFTGTVTPVNSVKLVARVPGYLEAVHFDDGQLVEAGAPLFTIEQDQFQAQLAQAEAQLKAAQAALVYAKMEAARYEGLQKKGAAAQVVVDNWKFQAQKTEADIAAAQAQVDIARLNLGYTTVRAPFAGQMGKNLFSVGSMVGGAGQPPALAEIVQLDPIYVEANISEKDFIEFRENVGDKRMTFGEVLRIPVDVGIEGKTGFHLRGTVEYVAPAIDQQTGTILVRGVVQNPDRSLLPGLAVRLRFPRGKVIANAIEIPDRAIQTDQGGRYVLVMNRQNVIEQRHVELGELTGGMRVVLSGVRPDDLIVIGDLWRASAGQKGTPKVIPIDEAATYGSGSQ